MTFPIGTVLFCKHCKTPYAESLVEMKNGDVCLASSFKSLGPTPLSAGLLMRCWECNSQIFPGAPEYTQIPKTINFREFL